MNAATAAGSSVGGSGVETGTRWDCHLHKSSNCEIASLTLADADAMTNATRDPETVFSQNETVPAGQANYVLFHIVPVKGTTQFAQRRYNARTTTTNEFWERLPPGAWYTPVYYSNSINDLDTFSTVLALFRDLDRESLSYGQSNKPTDFLKQHIVTDGSGRVTLCNKHLLRQTVRKNGSKPRYMTRIWLRGILKALFPNLTARGNNAATVIATNTPKWAIDLLNGQQQWQQGR